MLKLLVIRGGALGDFILTLPVFAALRRWFPQCRVEILGYPAIASLALAGGLADDVLPIESPRFTELFAPNGSCSTEVAAWFSTFDCIISYLYDPQDIFRSNVARYFSGQFVVGLHRPDETLSVHATELLLRPLQTLGICDADPCPHLPLPQPALVHSLLALHPGSGSKRKNWPESKWAELLQLLSAKSAFNVLVIGGEAEGERCARLAAELPTGRAEVAQNLPLPELAGRMRTCSAFIGHDSGITHLAAALNLPGLVLWGESALATWRPRSDRMKILLDPNGLDALPVAVVWDELKTFL